MERQRTCVGCGRVSDKATFARIARTKDGSIAHDQGNRSVGRGAYVCSVDCLRRSAASKRINRALRCNVQDDDIVRIEESLLASGFHAGKSKE